MQSVKKTLNTISCVLLYLSVVLVPLVGTGSAVISESTKIFWVFAVLFCGTAFLNLLLEGKFLAAVRKGVLLTLLFVAIFVIATVKYGAIFINKQDISFFAVYQMVVFAAYGCFAFAFFATHKKTVPISLLLFSITVSALVLICHKRYLFDMGVLRFLAAYGNPNVLGIFSTLSVLASLYLIAEHYPFRILSIVNMSISIAATVLTGSRSAVLALGLGLVVFFICFLFSFRKLPWKQAFAPVLKVFCIVLVLSCVSFVVLRPTDMNSLELTIGSLLTEPTEPSIPATESTPPVTESSPPVTESSPPVTESTPPVTEIAPPSTNVDGETPKNNAWHNFLQRFNLTSDGTSSFKNNMRLTIWKEYLLNAPEYWLFGTDYTLTGRPIVNNLVRDSHNTLIFTFFRFGIFALAILVCLLLVTGFRLLLRRRKTNGQMVILAMLITVSVISMLNDLLNTPIYFFILALASAAVADTDRTGNPTKHPKKRILHVFSTLNKGGAESRTMDIFRNMDSDNVGFDFAVTSPNPQQHFYYEEILGLGGKVHVIQSWRALGAMNYFAQWARIFREDAYEIVHCHAGLFSAIPMYVAWLNNIPVRIAHARNSSADKGSALSLKLNQLVTNLFCNRRIYCSEEAAAFSFGAGSTNGKNTYFLPNAVNLKNFQQITDDKKAQIKKDLGLPECSYVIGTVGNARPVKNHVFLVKAFHELLKQEPQAALLIVGNHEDDIEAKQYVTENGLSQHILFVGQRNDIPELLQIMDLFVLPSIREGAPGSAIEAQAANVPCLLSDPITRAVDVGTGLVFYLSLDDSFACWADKMLECCKMQKPAFGESIEILSNAGYDRQTSSKMLMNIYQGIAR